MKRTQLILFVIIILLTPGFTGVNGQSSTLLPIETLAGLANTVSGSRPFQVLQDFTSYTRDRRPEEYSDTWHESRLFARKAEEYGFSDVEILRYDRGPVWDGNKGELWLISTRLRKLVDFQDIPAVLAPGSVTGTYEGPLIWVENASDRATLESVDVSGKIVLTSSDTGRAFSNATSRGALGLINMNSPRPGVTPDAILWSSIGRPDRGFAFNISAPMLEDLKQFAETGPVTIRAVVEAEWREVDDEVITAVIPGDGSTDEWVYLSAHVFEGINKQGASDDGSGAVVILEAGRTLLEAIRSGYVGRPARNLRFLWVDEFRGTFSFLNSHAAEFERARVNLNIDMAGQNTELNKSAIRLYRMPDSRIHFVADVAEEFFEWVGSTNIERVHERSNGYGFSFPIIDPYGTRDPFRYRIEPFYGSSDHQVYNDRGVPAILFNNWPDMVYHSSHDRPNLMDPTQMKRAAFIAAATTLVAAGSPQADPVQVAAVAYNRGKSRIAAHLREWMNRLVSTSGPETAAFFKDLQQALPEWYKREMRNLETVKELSIGSTTGNPEMVRLTVSELKKRLASQEEDDREVIGTVYRMTAQARGASPERVELTPAEVEAGRLVPSWKKREGRTRASGLPGFSSMEVRNLIDGERSILEIRNAVNSEYGLEYGSISLAAVTDYVRRLEGNGQVFIEVR